MILDINRLLNPDDSINARELKNILITLTDAVNGIWSKFKGDVITISTDKAVTQKNFAHNLKFIPNTCIILSKSNDSASVTINYSLNTNQYINVTTTTIVDFKLLIGRFDL